jgi:hypothetical protein
VVNCSGHNLKTTTTQHLTYMALRLAVQRLVMGYDRIYQKHPLITAGEIQWYISVLTLEHISQHLLFALD